MRTKLISLLCLAAPLTLAACGGSTTATTADTGSTCTKADLALKSAGKLTVGTDNPAYPPWFGGGEKAAPWKINDPATGKGYESAVVYAVAKRLGFTPAEVTWTVVPFDKAFSPGKKDFDILANQVSISPQREKAVTFSSPYYTVNQAVIALKSNPAAKATTMAALKDVKFGAQVGTTSLSALKERVAPTKDVAVYNNQVDVITALKTKQVDAIVVDLPTGFYVTAAEIDNSTIVGQFPLVDGATGEQFGLVMQKDSPIATCVSGAVDALTSDGTLGTLEQTYLAEAGAPFLK